MTRQSFKIEFTVTMDSSDAKTVRRQVSENKSWRKAINELFRSGFGVEVDVDEFQWKAAAPAYREETGPALVHVREV